MLPSPHTWGEHGQAGSCDVGGPGKEANGGDGPGDHRRQTCNLEGDGGTQTLLGCVMCASKGMTNTKAQRRARQLHAGGPITPFLQQLAL